MGDKIERINAKISRGETVFGAHVSLTDHCITEMLGDMGYEFIWIDWEHSAMDRQHIQNHLIAARATNAAAFVRVPWNDPVIVKPVLEMGPDGIVFPMICTAEQARLAVASCTYPPRGIRGFGPRRVNNYGMMSNEEYLSKVDAGFWRIMQIEHIDAVKNLSEILTVEGIDSIVVGPNDLSGSIGLVTQTRHPEVMAIMDEIADKCRNAGKPFGVSMGYQQESLEDWKRRGVSWVGCGGDTSYIYTGGMNVLNSLGEIWK